MRRANKHVARQVVYAALTGGVNVALSGEQIADNEMQICENFIYGADSRCLEGRGGLAAGRSRFGAPILDFFYDVDTNVTVVFLTNQEIYSVVGVADIPQKIGTLTGTEAPVCCKFQDKLWMASGDKLQYYDFTDEGVRTVLESPLCDLVFERFGRLAAVRTGSDRITYSGFGDGTYWQESTNDTSSSVWVDVGYGDSGDILAVVPLATDVMILKSNGKVYQFSGDREESSWAIYNIANNADPVGRNCAVNIGNSVVFLSRRGLKTLAATMDYGNIATSDIGDRFNGLLTKGLYEPRMFHLKRHRMLLIRPSSDWSYFVCYNYGVGAATVLRFAFPVTSVAESADGIVVAADRMLYLWSVDYTTDAGSPISYKLRLKDVIGENRVLLKGIDVKLSSDHAGTAAVSVGKVAVKAPTNDRRKVRCNHAADLLEVEAVSSSRFRFEHIALEVADL